MTTYKKASPSSVFYEEIARPQCQYFSRLFTFMNGNVIGSFHGSIFVTRRAQEFLEGMFGPNDSKIRAQVLRDLLEDSKFSADIPYIVEQFDKTTKLTFVNPDENQFIKFGGFRDRAPELNIKSGLLKLLG